MEQEVKTSRIDQIRSRAYEIWEAEGRPHGRDLTHWLQAEAELIESPLRAVKRRESKAKLPPRQTVRARGQKKL